MNNHSNERGMALLVTLLVVVLLSTIVLSINDRSRLAFTKARNSALSLQAYYIMRSGVSAAMGFLQIDARETNIDTLSEPWAQMVKDFNVGDGTVTVETVDEASMFNINTLVTPQGNINEKAMERFGRLLMLLGLDESLSTRTAEWLKGNREHLVYTFMDTSELLLVPGFTDDILKKIERYITVYTNRRNPNNININTAGKEVLMALSPMLTEAIVEGILDYRKEHPFKVDLAGDLGQAPGLSDAELRTTFSDAIDVKSSNFSVHVEAKVVDVVRKGIAVVNRDGGNIRIAAWKEG
jgi:general secretion pathway protein K